MEKANGGVK